MRLRRSRLDGPGIRRRRKGRSFTYWTDGGEQVTDPDTLDRIQALVIPPAWTDVWICPWPNGHIQAVGLDSAGRRQYRYHDEWRRRRDREKFVRMVEFASALPALRSRIREDLRREDLCRERVLACAVRLLELGLFRVGGEQYADEHQTYGLATLRKRHAKVREDSVVFDFEGKGGKRISVAVADREVLRVVSELKARRGGGPDLFVWREGGKFVDVRSGDVNAYIKEATGGTFSAKDFRTWGATMLAAVSLAAIETLPRSPTARRRAVAATVKEVSESLGNTPAVCRRSYIDPRVVDHFEGGETVRRALEDLRRASPPLDVSSPEALRTLESAVIDLLTEEGAVVQVA